ncbi:hypothetical protein Btru_023164 [Bulinus truncatus]|nr:hypothetical protein Btru_023164 [Bulinus truncatus]
MLRQAVPDDKMLTDRTPNTTATNMNLLSGIALLLVQLPAVTAETIVMLPAPTLSYVHYHHVIGQSLRDLGHEVWICVPNYLLQKNDTIFNQGVNALSYGDELGDIEANFFQVTQISEIFWSGQPYSSSHVFSVNQFYINISSALLADSDLEDKIKILKPDLFILDNFKFQRHMVILPYKLDIPFAFVGFHHDSYMTRVPFTPAEEPCVVPTLVNKMGFMDRVKSTLIQFLNILFDPFYDHGLVKRFAPGKPDLTINEIILRAEVFVIFSDHIFEQPRPMLPNTKFVGGSSVSEPNSLTGEIHNFVNSAADGVIVVSFGGHDFRIPDTIISKMAAAFMKTDANVVWKVNWTTDRTDKILTLKWIPQNDLLGHPKTRLFISHCGKNGLYEALYHGVPILCFPIYGDQHYNARLIHSKGFGHYVDIREITSDELVHLISRVTSDAKYKANIQKGSKLFKELYKVPNKQAAYWFDHVMKYGGDYLRSFGQQMPLYQFLLMDVLALFVAVIGLFLLTLLVILRISWNAIFRNGKVKSKND